MKENNKSKTVQFKVQSLDSLGQGVSKENGEIVFIPKTLPGEEGIARINSSKKKVSFASLVELNKKSELRIDPDCPHYSECGGCDYLHMDYASEIDFKTKSMIDIFERQHRVQISDKLEILRADNRFSYRNRVQLHYSTNSKKIGFRSQGTRNILEVPNCLLPDPEVKRAVSSLYENKHWMTLTKGKKEGHIEIYHRNSKVDIVANQRYASSGFSQVNGPMNQKLLKQIDKKFREIEFKNKFCLDLFGGNGNLTANLEVETLVVDATPEKFINLRNNHQRYKRVDLFKDNSLELLKNETSKQPDLLMVDPPRSGFKELELFTQHYKPQEIIYVSCNPQTLARDIKNLQNEYQIERLFLVDFFPSTKHFESMMFLKRI